MSENLGGPPVVVAFPPRWLVAKEILNPVTELDDLARTLVKGAEAMRGVYLRMCDIIRSGLLPEHTAQTVLLRHFPQPRVSEILRVARAPDEVYRKYADGIFGFRAALRHCRMHTLTPDEELKRRKMRRSAERLAELVDGAATFTVAGHIVTVEKLAKV